MIEKIESGTNEERYAIGVFTIRGSDETERPTVASQRELALDCLYWEIIECFAVSVLPLACSAIRVTTTH